VTLKPSQPNWAVNLPVDNYCPHPRSPFIAITQPTADNLCVHHMQKNKGIEHHTRAVSAATPCPQCSQRHQET